MLEGLRYDLRHAIRSLVRHPGFAALATLSLAIGMAATTTLFSVVSALDLRALPYRDAERTVFVRLRYPPHAPRCDACLQPTPPRLFELEQASGVFQIVSGSNGHTYSFDGESESDIVRTTEVTPEHFAALGLSPRLGRVITVDDMRPDAPPAAVVSERFWRERFNADRNAIGRRITLNDEQGSGAPALFTVVGVMPASFNVPFQTDLWTPRKTLSRPMSVLAHLRRGITIDQARRAMNATMLRYAEQDPAMHGATIDLISLQDASGEMADRGGRRFVLLGIGLLVLLLAAGNVATLFMARVSAAEHEWATRSALGASTRRIVARIVLETAVVAITACVISVVLAGWGTGLVAAHFELNGIGLRAELDWRVIAFATSLAVVVALIAGALPAVGATRVDLSQRLRAGGAQGAVGTRRRPLHAVVMVGQVAGAVMLACGAGLLTKELWRLEHVSLGFKPDALALVTLGQGARMLATTSAQPPSAIIAATHAELARLAAVPAVKSVAAEGMGVGAKRKYRTTHDLTGDEISAEIAVSSEYFATLGAPILSGRGFQRADISGSAPVGIVNETAAQGLWPGESPLGKEIVAATPNGSIEIVTVVGVVHDVRIHLGRAAPRTPLLYRPFDQAPGTLRYYWVRAADDEASMIAGLRPVLRELTPGHRLVRDSWFQSGERFNEELVPPRFNATALALFASFAVLLAAMGIFGVVAFAVSRQTREIGVRIALGASATNILRVVSGPAFVIGITGVVVGLGATLAFTKVLRSMLAGTSPVDPTILASTVVAMIVVLLAATYAPARHAMRIDPAAALRDE